MDLRSREAYNKMVEEAYKILPETGYKQLSTRFNPPTVQIFYQGKNKTVIINFKEIAEYLDRDPNLMRKFLSLELAAPSSPSNGRLILHTRVDETTLQNTINYFIKRYVRCPVCGGYDTKLKKIGKNFLMKCEICGAESPTPPIK